MIDSVTIFTKGGIVLWSYTFGQLDVARSFAGKCDPVDYVVKTVFLEERLGTSTTASETSIANHYLKWTTLNELDVVFVAVYEGVARVSYVDKLLHLLKNEFLGLLPSELKNAVRRDVTKAQSELLVLFRDSSVLDKKFLSLLDRCDSMTEKKKLANCSPKKTRQKGSNGKEDEAKKSKKPPTTWSTQKVTKQTMAELDFSKMDGDKVGLSRYMDDLDAISDPKSEGGFDQAEFEEQADDDSPNLGFFNRISNAIKNVTGSKVLTAEDLDSILSEFKTALMAKNVAAEVVEQLSQSVRASLIGTKTESFTSIRTTLKQSLTEAIQKILTQNKSIDVLRMANEAKEKSKVFSICFLGINGVGKSTNLAKVAYYLKHKGNLNVMIAACDTFRAGAVEQLRTHARNLEIHLFEQGYGKDASIIAKNALRFAASEGYNVVLIDTAGRMQDNEPLMRAIVKLVSLNSPDLVLFVGEALVGNDAIDQLLKFDRSLVDYAPINATTPKRIDGIILTKFDTVDDKVGAALSMAYISRQPVVFVGTGQKYTHLSTLKVGRVTNWKKKSKQSVHA